MLLNCAVGEDSWQSLGLQGTQSLSCVQLFATPWTTACQASWPSLTPEACSNSCPSSWWCLQPSHHLSSPSPPTFNLSQHQGLFHWVSSLHQVAKVLEFQLWHQSFQWIFRIHFPLELTGLISLQSKGLSRVFSNTTVQNYQFFGARLSNKRDKIKIYIKKRFASGQKSDGAPYIEKDSFIVYNPQPIAVKTSQYMQQFLWDLTLVR